MLCKIMAHKLLRGVKKSPTVCHCEISFVPRNGYMRGHQRCFCSCVVYCWNGQQQTTLFFFFFFFLMSYILQYREQLCDNMATRLSLVLSQQLNRSHGCYLVKNLPHDVHKSALNDLEIQA